MTFAASCPSYALTTRGRLVVRVEGLLGLLPVADLAARYGIARQSVRHLLREFDLSDTDTLNRLSTNLPILYRLWRRDAKANGLDQPWGEAIQAAISDATREPVRIMEAAICRLSALEAVTASQGLSKADTEPAAPPLAQTA